MYKMSIESTVMPLRELIVNIIEPFNASQQAYSRYQFCLDNKTHYYNTLVTTNLLSNWERYFISDRSRLYSKGTVRLENLYLIYAHPLYMNLTATEAWFVLAGVMILTQVYGDGNHRTGRYVYNRFTGQYFDFDKVHQIQILHDVTVPFSASACEYFIKSLMNIYRY
jgi:hypothetical protein